MKTMVLFILLMVALPLSAQETEPVVPVINHQFEIDSPVTQSRDIRATNFGAKLALEGDILAIGAPSEMLGDNTRAGAVYVYQRIGESWELQQKITPESGTGFGIAVGFDNGMLIVSQWSIALHFYSFNEESGWLLVDSIIDEDDQRTDQFGIDFAIKNDFLAISELSEVTSKGEVKIFRNIAGEWALDQTLTGDPNHRPLNWIYGYTLDISDDGLILAVGEPDFDNASDGTVYIYNFNGEDWVLEKKIEDAGTLGVSLDLIGSGTDMLLAASDIGTYSETVQTPGEVFVFSRLTEWGIVRHVVNDADATFGFFGHDVALVGPPSNAALFVSALPERNSDSTFPPARFYIYDVNTGTQLAEIVSPGEADLDGDGRPDTDQFGRALAIDGVGENLKIAIGAPGLLDGSERIYVLSHDPNPEELVDAGNFESGSRDVILNAWNRTPAAKLRCGKGVGESCGIKFKAGIGSRVWQNVDLAQAGLLPGDAVLFAADTMVKGSSSLKVTLKVIYTDGFKALVNLKIDNTNGVYRRVMTAPAIFVAQGRTLAKIQIRVQHNSQPGAAFLDNVSLVRVAGNSAR